MANYNWGKQSGAGGYLGEESIPDLSTNDAHQDELGFKGGSDGQRSGGSFRATPERFTDNGDTDDADSGAGGPKSGYGDNGDSSEGTGRRSFVQSGFGLEGTTGSTNGNGTGGSDRHSREIDTSSKAAIDPRPPASDQATGRSGDGWHPEDLEHAQGSKKHELMNKIKEKMPGHHSAAGGEANDANAAPKKGVIGKIKEKLPGHHGNDSGM